MIGLLRVRAWEVGTIVVARDRPPHPVAEMLFVGNAEPEPPVIGRSFGVIYRLSGNAHDRDPRLAALATVRRLVDRLSNSHCAVDIRHGYT